jgi:hypothetical protein
MPTSGEPNFFAAFHSDIAILFDGTAHHMHHDDLVCSCHNEVKA